VKLSMVRSKFQGGAAMSYVVRRALVPTTFAFVFAWIVSGCSSTSSKTAGAMGTSGQTGSAAIGLDMTPGGFTITVENRAGHPLVDMKVAINPVSRSAPYTATVSRLETGSKRDFSLGEFTEHGARINLNVVRPKEVVVTASDSDGKRYEATLPWKP
jgi:hypothetical protein